MMAYLEVDDDDKSLPLVCWSWSYFHATIRSF